MALIFVGIAIVTLDNAFLFTDGRYFLQAEKQLDSCVPSLHYRSQTQRGFDGSMGRNWTLMKQGLPGTSLT